MIIDGHSHVTLPISEHIKAMDNASVSKTVLFSTTFHPETAKNLQEIKASMTFLSDLLSGKKGSMIEARKKSNLELMEVIKQYPTRYIGFGAVPAGLDFDTTSQYIEENILKNNLTGMGEFVVGSGQVYLLENIFKASLDFGRLPIWIHAFNPLTLQDIKEIAVFAGKYPTIPIILGHMGGSNWLETMELVKEIPNLYLDTSAYFSTFILGVVINEIPQKCIFGVDRPFGDLQLSIDAVLKVARSKAVVNAVLGENIAALLQI